MKPPPAASDIIRVPYGKRTGPANGGACPFGDPYGTRTHVTAVKGRCLNHLTNGPKKEGACGDIWSSLLLLVESSGLEPLTFRV